MILRGKVFGVIEARVRQLFEEYLERDFSTERKTRSNKDQNFLNFDKKRKLTYTTLSIYIYKWSIEFRDDPSRLDEI